MSVAKPKRPAEPAQIPAQIAATIDLQRQQLYKASAVVDMCRYACASLYEGFDPEQLAEALQVVDDLVDDVASVLEQFAGDDAADDDESAS